MPKMRYEEKDFVEVFDADGIQLPSVPKEWVGTRLLPKGVSTSKAGKSKSEAKQSSGKYGSLKKAELQNLIAERNLARAEEDLISDEGTVPELVARLEADDEKQA